jgi:hypothetical protein
MGSKALLIEDDGLHSGLSRIEGLVLSQTQTQQLEESRVDHVSLLTGMEG